MRRHSGMTLVELIVIIVIIGILAVVAIPRMNNADFRAQEFRDRTVSALRYAHKSAVSHRRIVCVTFAAATLTLVIDSNGSGACDNNDAPLMLPGTNVNVVQSGDAASAFINPVPGVLVFQSDGRSGGAVVSIFGQTNLVVNGTTGYVE
jgi:MSHA pilin protein MshC